jgi:hypothetical protein
VKKKPELLPRQLILGLASLGEQFVFVRRSRYKIMMEVKK